MSASVALKLLWDALGSQTQRNHHQSEAIDFRFQGVVGDLRLGSLNVAPAPYFSTMSVNPEALQVASDQASPPGLFVNALGC